MRSAISFLASTLALSSVSGQIPCDDAYGAHCPAESGWAVGDCLRKVSGDLPAECVRFMDLQEEACRGDISKHCNGKEYTGEVISCLMEWTKPDALSADCAAALEAYRPKQQTERVKSNEEKKRADARRKTRRQAAARAGKEF